MILVVYLGHEILPPLEVIFFSKAVMGFMRTCLNPFRAPKSLPILNPSNFVPREGFQW